MGLSPRAVFFCVSIYNKLSYWSSPRLLLWPLLPACVFPLLGLLLEELEKGPRLLLVRAPA